MYFTHAHINLLFIKKVLLFIFFFSCALFSQPSSSCSISQKSRFLFQNSCVGYFGAEANKNISLLFVCVCVCVCVYVCVCACDDGCFYNAPLQICICICADCMRRALTLRAVGWGGRWGPLQGLCVCVEGGSCWRFHPPRQSRPLLPDGSLLSSAMCLVCVCVCVCVCVYGQRQIQRRRE